MKIVRRLAIGVLAFLGISSIVGAVPLILDPSGRLMHMPLVLLEHSPFRSFLIPGIILLLANGVLSLQVMYSAARRWSGYGWWVAFQGCVIGGWIVVEVIILRAAMWAHYFYLGIGLVLIVLGLMLTRDTQTIPVRTAVQ